MMQRKDISKYIYKYFIEKDEKENFVKGIVKWEHKLETELDSSMLFNDIYRITNDTKLRNFQFKLLHHILPKYLYIYFEISFLCIILVIKDGFISKSSVL
jgi:hypothetical protein